MFKIECNDLSKLLNTKYKLKASSIKQSIKTTHEILRNKLKNLLNNGIRSYITAHLFDIMPRNKNQLNLIPQLLIKIGENFNIRVKMAIKKRNATYAKKLPPQYDLYEIRNEIKEFVRIG